MREVISISIGQAGVQLSNAAWELFCTEHGILANGSLKDNLKDDDSSAFETFFQEVPGNQYVPRAINVDLEPTVLDEVRTGPYRNLWHPDQLISGFEDAANNYARGHFTLGKLIIDDAVDRIRKAADMCTMLQGFIVLNSVGGGTGSGFSSLVLERLAVDFTKRMKLQTVIMPSANMSTAIVDPYNAVLSMASSTEYADISSMFDNESVYKICNRNLDLSRPTYNNLNRVIAQVMSSLTVSLRYESSLNGDLDQLVTNLVPFPRIHFPALNYVPLLSVRRAEHERLTCKELTRSIFEKRSQLLCLNMSEAKYLSCCMQFRGDITPIEVNSAIFEIKRRTDIKFISWCPTGFKLGINCQPPVSVSGSEMAQVKRSVMMLTNTSAIGQVWESFGRKFDILFSKRSFVHWYVGEGMEEGEFNEAKDELVSLVNDHKEAAIDDDEEEEEEEDAPPPLSSVPVPVKRDGGAEEAEEAEEGEQEEGIGGGEEGGAGVGEGGEEEGEADETEATEENEEDNETDEEEDNETDEEEDNETEADEEENETEADEEANETENEEPEATEETNDEEGETEAEDAEVNEEEDEVAEDEANEDEAENELFGLY